MEELDLKELFQMFWSKKTLIILMVILFSLVGAIYSYGFVKPVYQSSTTLVLAKSENGETQTVTDASITTTDITLNSKLVSTYGVIVKSKNVVRQVISNLGLNLDEDVIRNNITVTQEKDTEVIRIAVTNANPNYSTAIANEIAKVFSQTVKEYYKINNVYVLDEAELPDGPSNINHPKDIAIFALIGLVISAAYIFILNMLDTTIKTAEDVEKLCNVPVLANITIYNYENEKGGKR